MTSLVTGASGFIGSHLVDALCARGDPVRAMLRRTSSKQNLEGSPAELVYAGLDDVDAIATALDGVETVFHVAGVTSAFNREQFERANTLGVANLFEAVRKARPGPRRVILMSSLMAAGPSHPNVARREHHRTREYTLYGASKLAGERIGYEVARSGSTEVLILRPPLVYGPRDQDVLQMIKAANTHVVGQAGLQAKWLSALYIADLVRATLLVADRGTPLPRESEDHVLAGGGEPYHHIPRDPVHPAGQGIYYFTDGGRHTESSFGQTAARVLGKRAVTVSVPGPLVLAAGFLTQSVGRLRGRAPALSLDKARGTLSSGWWCNDAKATAELGYRPEYPLERGLEQTVRWLRDHGEL